MGSRAIVLPTSQVVYYAGKPIETAVYCFYKLALSKNRNVSLFLVLPAQ